MALVNAQRVQRTLQSAVVQFQTGDLDGAAELCAGLLKKQPKNHDALHILGAIRLRQDDPAAALKLLKSAAKRAPGNAEILANLGAAYRASGTPERAVETLKKAVRLDPRNVSAQFNLGNAANDAADPRTAVAAYRAVLRLNPQQTDARRALAHALQSSGEIPDALTELKLLEEVEAGNADTLNRLGVLLAETGQTRQAVQKLREAYALSPDDADIATNLANVLSLLFDVDEALGLYRQALSHTPDCPDLLNNIGNTLSRGGDSEAAEKTYRRSLETNPDHPDTHASLANNLLADGNFPEGWKHYLYRPSTRGISGQHYRTPFPDDLGGKRVLVTADQGLGDQIFFARFIPGLRDRGANVAYRPEARLENMIARANIADEVAGSEQRIQADYVVSAGDLPYLLGGADMKTPAPFPIPALEDKVSRLRGILNSFGPRPWVGVTWRAGTPNVRLALSKGIPVPDLAGAVTGSAGSLVVIQRDCDPADLGAFESVVGRPVLDLSGVNDDLEDLLALSGLLDRYIGVSNTMTHMRAARGGVSDVLVPIPAEFRWMNRGESTPWFDGSRVYRQDPDGGWDAACAALGETLQA